MLIDDSEQAIYNSAYQSGLCSYLSSALLQLVPL